MGQEICIGYKSFDVTIRRAKRRQHLMKMWNFHCNCERCSFNGEITQAAINRIPHIGEIYQNEKLPSPDFTDFDDQLKRVCNVRTRWTPQIDAFGLVYERELRKRAEQLQVIIEEDID